MKWPVFWRKPKKPKRKRSLVSVEGRGPSSYLVASTEQPTRFETGIRGRLQKAGLIESTVNPKTSIKLSGERVSGVTYPDDFDDFQDYMDAYYYVPFVARAVDIKHFMVWQAGYELEGDEKDIEKINEFLKEIEADTVIRDGSLYAIIFGNMYWKVEREEGVKLKPLNPMKMGIKLNEDGTIQSYVYTPKFGEKETFQPDEILHLKFNAEPWSLFGISSLRRVLPTVKAILFMEEKLPWIARRSADPLLAIQIGGPENPVDKDTFDTIKNMILNRKPGEDIFHDGTIKIEEVYKAPGIANRQAIEPLLGHFRENLVAGLGVPEVALGFGRTTTMATAEYQERILEGEIRAYQRALKRFHENQLFKLVETRDVVKLVWKPLKPEDLYKLSERLCREITHGIVGPIYARQRLGYPEEAGKGTYIDQRLVPTGYEPEMSAQKEVLFRSYPMWFEDVDEIVLLLKDPSDVDVKTIRYITINDEKGIRLTVARLKSDPSYRYIVKITFNKQKFAWTLDKAKQWYSQTFPRVWAQLQKEKKVLREVKV